MNRSRGLLLAVFLGVFALPAGLDAQPKPKDDKYTKEANKHIGLAMVKQNPDEQKAAYRAALAALEEGFVKEPNNPKNWMLAGQAHVGLLDFKAADDAFKKALEMYPQYAEDIETERENGWVNGFTAGVKLMDEQKYTEAIAILEGAHLLYAKRPEGLLNMGSIYAHLQQLDKAQWAFEEAIKAINGPKFQTLDPDGQASWKRYEELSKLNISQMHGQRGVAAFETKDFAAAANWFTKASEANPHSRDYLYNIVQAQFAMAQDLEEKRDSTLAPGKAPQDAELIKIYPGLEPQIRKVLTLDPNSSPLYLIMARSQRRLGELTGQADAGQKKALETLTFYDAMPVYVNELIVTSGDSTATVKGTLTNHKGEPGKQVKIKVTLVGSDGTEIGSQEGTATLGPLSTPEKAAEPATFEITIPNVKRSVAGWKYEIIP
jgi:tetratricopeptide (TPR) repeat protein